KNYVVKRKYCRAPPPELSKSAMKYPHWVACGYMTAPVPPEGNFCTICVFTMYYKVFSASRKDRLVIPRCLLIILLAACFVAAPARAQQATGATFGNVIQLAGGTPADVVLDEPRQLLYLISNSTSQILVIDYTTGVAVNSIGVGKSPVAGAISMDGNF